MSLFEEWKEMAESPQNQVQSSAFWKDYFDREKEIYRTLLSEKDTVQQGTLGELAEKFGMDDVYFTGFMGGIDSSLKKESGVDKLTHSSKIKLDIDFEKLYFNMHEAKAKWLYELTEWEGVLSREKRAEIYKNWRASKQAVTEKTAGRNDPCPCGSGLKYKKCCGK